MECRALIYKTLKSIVPFTSQMSRDNTAFSTDNIKSTCSSTILTNVLTRQAISVGYSIPALFYAAYRFQFVPHCPRRLADMLAVHFMQQD